MEYNFRDIFSSLVQNINYECQNFEISAEKIIESTCLCACHLQVVSLAFVHVVKKKIYHLFV